MLSSICAWRRVAMRMPAPYDDALQGFLPTISADTDEAVADRLPPAAIRSRGYVLAGAAGRPAVLQRRRRRRSSSRPRMTRLPTPPAARRSRQPPADDRQAVRLNNRLRGMVDAASGRPDADVAGRRPSLRGGAIRLQSRDATALPCIETALAKEQDPASSKALAEARAAIIIGESDASDDGRVSPRSPSFGIAATRTRWRCLPRPAGRRAGTSPARPPPSAAIPSSSAARAVGRRAERLVRRSRSARCCCSPRSASPSPSA